jgi:NAD(P)-dependent dehydrogenase (short-subunit alcohol dehydrogenase family)
VFTCCKAALPQLRLARARGRGDALIINISATLQYGATHYQIHASAAKAAIDSMTRTLALEWGEYGIRVNGVAPGPIANTAGMTKLAPGATMDDFVGMVPIGRWGSTFDIGYACLFLASPVTGGFITCTRRRRRRACLAAAAGGSGGAVNRASAGDESENVGRGCVDCTRMSRCTGATAEERAMTPLKTMWCRPWPMSAVDAPASGLMEMP